MNMLSSRRPARKRHLQQELFAPRKPHKPRKPRKPRKPKPHAREPHRTRPAFKACHPLHIVLRIAAAVGSMRRRAMYTAIRRASIVAACRERIRIVHISIQRQHIHMLVEASDKHALARGMQGFEISAARHINAALGDRDRPRRGAVFADRYHLEVITGPRRAHHALSYVLNNWRKHGEDRSGIAATWLVDPFSSGIRFADWKELEGKAFLWNHRETYDPLMVRRPASWLLTQGWKLHGTISARDVPGRMS
jgi:REP element-mobilizing transposase RayT